MTLPPGADRGTRLRSVEALQQVAGNTHVEHVLRGHPDLVVQRSSAVWASTYPLSQAVATFLRNQGHTGSPADVADGEIMWIIGHDHELGDGTAEAQRLLQLGYVGSLRKTVRLVVCYAANRPPGALSSPAQNIANILRTPVEASTTIVTAYVDLATLNIWGNYVTFQPQTPVEDITERLGNLGL